MAELEHEHHAITGLVSVIIPTYNRSALAVRAVESVLAQDYPHKQIIVIDDGSTDDTRQRMAAFPQVEYYWQENARQAAARNHGLHHAKGEFLASLDSDDFWHPTFLSRSVAVLRQQNIGFVFSMWEPAGPDFVPDFWTNSRLRALADLRPFQRNLQNNWYHLSSAETRLLFLRHCWAPSSSVLLRSALVAHGWNTNMRVSDDWMMLMELVLKREVSCAWTADILWTKWQDGSNILDHFGDPAKRAKSEVHDDEIILASLGSLMTPDERRLVRRRLMKSLCDLGYFESRQGQVCTAMRTFLRAMRYHPSRRPVVEILKAIARPAISSRSSLKAE